MPRARLGDLAGQPIDALDLAAARVLGARHLIEAAMLWREPRRRQVELGVAIDATHGATMVVLAAAAPGRRRLASLSALGAGLFAAGGILTSRGASSPGKRL
jgi:hypothetical protein